MERQTWWADDDSGRGEARVEPSSAVSRTPAHRRIPRMVRGEPADLLRAAGPWPGARDAGREPGGHLAATRGHDPRTGGARPALLESAHPRHRALCGRHDHPWVRRSPRRHGAEEPTRRVHRRHPPGVARRDLGVAAYPDRLPDDG